MAFTLLSFVFLAIICLFDPHSGEIAAMANIYVPAVLHLCRKYSPLQSGSSLGRLQGPRHSNKAGNRTPVILPTVSHFIVPTWCCVTSVCMGGCVLLLLLLLTVTSSDSFAGDPVHLNQVIRCTERHRVLQPVTHCCHQTFNVTTTSDEQFTG